MTDWSATLTAPGSRADSGGVTVWSWTVHSDNQTGGVGTGSGKPARNALPGASCWHAVGHAPDNAPPAAAASAAANRA